MGKLTHVRQSGAVEMVDVGIKLDTAREAVARGRVTMQPQTLTLIREGALKKGDVLAAARIAGIMAAKKTSDLIPLCHPIALSYINVDLTFDKSDKRAGVLIEARVRTTGKTGVEMEALTAVAVAGLTIYDMAKAVDRQMRIEDIRLVEKHGGRSGDLVLESD